MTRSHSVGFLASMTLVVFGCSTETIIFQQHPPVSDAGADSSGPDPSVDAGSSEDVLTAPDSMSAPDTSPVDTSAEQLCVDTINKYRATLSLPAYTRWTANESCTAGQGLADSKTGTPHSAFGTCGESAQNECPGWPGPPGTMIPSCLDMMWKEGPGSDFQLHGHYINMSSTSYTMVACGFATASDGSIWAVQDFQ